MQQNTKRWLRADRDETINQILSESSKFAKKKNKSRHDGVDNMIHWKLCKKLIFYLTIKCYMHKPESV